MLNASRKWLLLIILIICCSSSLETEVQEEDLLKIMMKKINNDKFNLTCIARGHIKHEGISLAGPEVNQNCQENNSKLYEYIQLNETLLYLDLPPVFDQQWGVFPIHAPTRAITLRRNEYLWISVKYKEDLIIQNENNLFRLKIICKENGLWVHLQLQSLSTHLSVKSDMCSVEDSFAYSNDTNERLLTINSFYKEHRYNVIPITNNMLSISTQGKEMRKFVFKIQKLYGRNIRLSYSLKCSSCNSMVRLEMLEILKYAGEKMGIITLTPQNNFKWNTVDLNVDRKVPLGSTIDVVVTVLSAPITFLTLVIRNLFFHEEFVGKSISTLVDSTEISNHICESMESNRITTPGSVNSNDNKNELRFPQFKLCNLC